MNAKTRKKPRVLVAVMLFAAVASSANAQTKMLNWLYERVGVETAKDKKQAEENEKWQKALFVDEESKKELPLAVQRSKCNLCHVHGKKKTVRDDFGERLSKRIHTHLDMDEKEINGALEKDAPQEIQSKIEQVFYRSLDEVLEQRIDLEDKESETFRDQWKRGHLKPVFRLL